MKKRILLPTTDQQALLDQVKVRLIERHEYARFQSVLAQEHFLGRIKPIGERLCYVAEDSRGKWLALLVFNAAAKHLKPRDQWIGWTARQRERRLRLVVNNSRFLLRPRATVPNLGSKVLGLVLDRLSQDWQNQYGHPVVVVESFVDPEKFDGALYRAQGWEELGLTDGWGRCRRDYYVKHDRPKRLFVRPLCPNACRSLQAEHLRPELALVESQETPSCPLKVRLIQSIAAHFQQVPDYRSQVESYPLWSLLTLVLLAVLSGSPRGQKDLVKFAKRLTQPQRRALGIRQNPQGQYPAPCQSTFSRFFQKVDGGLVNQVILAIQEKIRGPVPAGGLIVIDGKEPLHGSGEAILTAVQAVTQFYLGSAMVKKKTNEIPVARQLLGPLDLRDGLVTGDALHTQTETARFLVLEKGADYLFTVKDNQPTLRQNIEQLIPAPEAGFSPTPGHRHLRADGGVE